MIDMTKKEFRHLVVQSGYASSATVTEYYKLHPDKTEYDESDIIPVYRLENSFASIKRITKRKG